MINQQRFLKKDGIILFFIILIALVLRLYKINIPLADFHSWRQADTAAVSRNFIRYGFDLLHPRYDDLSSIQSGLENPQGYRMVEFPLYNTFSAYLVKVVPQLDVVIASRIINIFFTLLTISVIYYLGLKEVNREVAFFSALTFSIMPFFVFYTRIILPEPTALGLVMISIFFGYQIKDIKNKLVKNFFYFVSLTFFSLSLLVKPTTIFFSIVFFYLFWKNESIYILKKTYFYFFYILALLPLILWRIYIQNFPEGIPANQWLITSVNTSKGLENIFFRPAFFRWIFFERINNLIFGGYLTFFALLGLITKNKKPLFYFFYLTSFLYLFTFQGGNVQHEYYQILILPSLAFAVGNGINFLLKTQKKIFLNSFSLFFVFLIFILSFYFSFQLIKDRYSYPQDLINIARISQKFIPPEKKVVTDRNGDTTLLFLMDRRGAPAIYKEPLELKKLGYQYLITQNMEYFEKLKKEFKVVFESNNFGIVEL